MTRDCGHCTLGIERSAVCLTCQKHTYIHGVTVLTSCARHGDDCVQDRFLETQGVSGMSGSHPAGDVRCPSVARVGWTLAPA